MVEVPKGNAGVLYYDIIGRYIELHTTHLCLVVCTICDRPFHCLGRISSLWYAKFETQPQKSSASATLDADTIHDVEIRPYFYGVVQAIADFRQVIILIFNFIILFLHIRLIESCQLKLNSMIF